jgi:DNA-binding response OmpR family regulator
MSHILIVDDHSPARSLIRAIVTLDGHTVSEAENGEDALTRIADTDYDLVILDLVMPGVDGYQVLERLRAMDGHQNAAVIAVSSEGEEVDLLRAAGLGALDHLSKPFGYDQMEKSIKRVLNATPEQVIEMRDARTAQAEAYHAVISLVDESKPERRRLFRRAKSAHR